MCGASAVCGMSNYSGDFTMSRECECGMDPIEKVAMKERGFVRVFASARRVVV